MEETDPTEIIDVPVEQPRTSFELFIEQLEAYRVKLNQEQSRSDLEHLIVDFFSVHIIAAFEKMGNTLENKELSSMSETELHQTYLVVYTSADYIKNLAILHRDVLLELTKNVVYEQDYNYSQEKLVKHLKDSQEILSRAISTALENLRSEERSLSNKKNKIKFIHRAMSNMTSPWPSYSRQLIELTEQMDFIMSSQISVLKNHDYFTALKKALHSIDAQFQSLLTHYKDTVKSVSDKIAASELLNGDYGIEQALERGNQMGNVQRSSQLNEDIRAIVSQLELEELPVDSYGGTLQVRELQLSRTVQKWLDYEIYPLLADLYAIEENLKLKVHLRLNSLAKLLNLNKENPVFELSRVFNIIDEELTAASELSLQIKNGIEGKLDQELHVGAFYTQENFLNVPIQTTIEKSQKDFISNLLIRIRRVLKMVRSWYKENTYVSNRSALQETTMCISDRMRFTELGHYDSLFMNRNFIGDLFYVVRKEEEKEFVRAVEEWNATFAKAVLITGGTSSGKSTFMQQTVKRTIKNQVIHLQPYSSLTIDGRKFITTANLGTALDHIKKSSQIHRSRPVLCIDNLESWQDHENNIVANVRLLLRFIEEESQDVFVVVACSSMFRKHLNNRFDFDDRFACILDMSRSNNKEILKAVSVRHETSHKALTNEDGETLGKSQMEKKILHIARQLDNNIGAVLQSWAFHTKLIGEDQVRFITSNHEFVSFFNDTELSILKQVIIYKNTSERSLKRITASAYDHKYKASLKRLINVKILIRNLEGQLLVNPVIVHELERIFNKKMNL
ncbi:MAG: hypothetical protein NWQ09_02600 [Nonlabens sp.]|nr:hypothetical protein [Nonlabens sp.]